MQLEKKTPSLMGQANKANVLHLIHSHGPISRADVAKALHMSRSTISSIVDQLLQEGRVQEGSVGESTPAGGRKPVELHFVPDAKYAVGVDIGATKTIAVVTDLDGNVVHRAKFPSTATGQPSMDHIYGQLQQFLEAAEVDPGDIVGTGIGFPGVTVLEKGLIVDAPGLQLHNFEASAFFDGLPGQVLVDNDVNLAVVGERWKGAAIGHDHVALIAIGTGIGSGFIFGGRVYRGAQGYAGEMGHVHVDPKSPGPKMGLSDYGPLEQVASGRGIEERVRQRLADYPDSSLHHGPIQTDRIFEAAAFGDPLASSVVAEAIQYLSFSIANLVTLLNPNIVILAGGVSRVGTPLVSQIQQGVARLSPIPCNIVLAGLGEDAAAIGGAAAVLVQSGELRLAGIDDWLTLSTVTDALRSNL